MAPKWLELLNVLQIKSKRDSLTAVTIVAMSVKVYTLSTLVLIAMIQPEGQARITQPRGFGPRTVNRAKGKLSDNLRSKFREGLKTMAMEDVQTIVDGTNALYEGFAASRKWFSKLKDRVKNDKYGDLRRNSTSAQILSMEIHECSPLSEMNRCFSTCRHSKSGTYRYCFLDSAQHKWDYCQCKLKDDVFNYLYATKNDFLAPQVEPVMTPLEIGLTTALSLLATIIVMVATHAFVRYRRERAQAANQQLVFAQMMPMVPPAQPPNVQGVLPAAA